MGKSKDPRVRDDLLEGATEYVLRHGLADLSLRPLGKALSTNARMLIYHFGTKEALVAAVLERATTRHQRALQALAAQEQPAQALRAFWYRLAHADTRPLLGLLFEIDVLGLHEPAYAAFSQRAFASWREVIIDLLTPRHGDPRARVLATLVVGTVSGLLLDLVVSGETERLDRAFKLFIDTLLEE